MTSPSVVRLLRGALRHRNLTSAASVPKDESILMNLMQKRRRSSSSYYYYYSSSSDDAKNEREIYVGAFSTVVRRVKLLSMGSLGATVVGCPLLIEFSQTGLEASTKLLLASSMSSIGTFTTFLLQWFVRPYVHRLWIKDGNVVTAEKTSLLLQKYRRSFKVAEMKLSDSAHPLVTWEDVGGEKYYVEPAQTTDEIYSLLQLKRFEPDTSKDFAPDDDDDEEEDGVLPK